MTVLNLSHTWPSYFLSLIYQSRNSDKDDQSHTGQANTAGRKQQLNIQIKNKAKLKQVNEPKKTQVKNKQTIQKLNNLLFQRNRERKKTDTPKPSTEPTQIDVLYYQSSQQ